MNPGLNDYYRTQGLPATAAVTILKIPTVGSSVGIAGIVYTYGADGFVGRTREEVAQYLAAGVNADRNKQDRHGNNQPIGRVYAMHYGNVVRLIATEPGVAGNNLPLVTDDSTAFSLSESLFSGGEAAANLPVAPAATTKTWAKLAYTAHATPNTAKVLSESSLLVRYAKVFAGASNTVVLTMGPTSAADMENVEVGLPVAIDAPANTAFDLGLWFGKSSVTVETAVIFYCPA